MQDYKDYSSSIWISWQAIKKSKSPFWWNFGIFRHYFVFSVHISLRSSLLGFYLPILRWQSKLPWINDISAGTLFGGPFIPGVTFARERVTSSPTQPDVSHRTKSNKLSINDRTQSNSFDFVSSISFDSWTPSNSIERVRLRSKTERSMCYAGTQLCKCIHILPKQKS